MGLLYTIAHRYWLPSDIIGDCQIPSPLPHPTSHLCGARTLKCIHCSLFFIADMKTGCILLMPDPPNRARAGSGAPRAGVLPATASPGRPPARSLPRRRGCAAALGYNPLLGLCGRF